MTFGLENLFIFGTFSDFYCTSPGVKSGGARAHNSPGAESLRGAKSHNVTSTFFSTVHYFRKTSGSNMGALILFLSPGAT